VERRPSDGGDVAGTSFVRGRQRDETHAADREGVGHANLGPDQDHEPQLRRVQAAQRAAMRLGKGVQR